MANQTETPWWDPDRHAGRRPLLLARNRIQSAIRDWLGAQDFLEIDPGALAISPSVSAKPSAKSRRSWGVAISTA